jgi:hypothetical protein
MDDAIVIRKIREAITVSSGIAEYFMKPVNLIDFGYDKSYNYVLCCLAVTAINKTKEVSVINSLLYNALNISLDLYYTYSNLTRFELPSFDNKNFKDFVFMLAKRHAKTMTKLDAIIFCSEYTSNNKFHEFLRTSEIKRDDDM